MKKNTLFILLFLSALSGYSQVSNYTFSQTNNNPYVLISGEHTLGDTSADRVFFTDPGIPAGSGTTKTGPGLPIGFNFVFNSTVYDSFGVSNDGWISLGTTSSSLGVNLGTTNLYDPIGSVASTGSDVLCARIAALVIDLQAQAGSSLSYKTIGSYPNRTLVVQWSNYRLKGSGADSFNFQIRLNEGINTVDLAYGAFASDASVANAQIGLRGGPASPANNFSIVTSSTGWGAIVASTTITDVVMTDSNRMPASGQTLTWTPPVCGSPMSLVASAITTNSATVSWTGNTPLPTDYQYVVTATNTLPTGSGTAVSGSSPTVPLSGLNSNTLYYVYLRSDCVYGFASWILAGTFRTKCDDATTFWENLDSYTYDPSNLMVPYCWDNTFTTGSAYMLSEQAHPNLGSWPNKLYLKGDGSKGTVAYAILPKVSNLQTGTNRLRFTAYASDIERTLDVGYFTDSANANSFVTLETIHLSSYADISVAPSYSIEPSGIPAGVKSLVFRNIGVSVGITEAYIDDVVWEPNPACGDVSAIVTKGATNSSVDVSWTPGGTETNWQYGYDVATVNDPTNLSPVDVSSKTITINGLASGTSYKVWIRSKCSSGLGSWMGPVVFSTTCAPVDSFTQNFDVNPDSFPPACWSKVGTTGKLSLIGTSNPAAPSAPEVLVLNSSSKADFAMIAMPPLSNAGTGTNRLKFRLRGSDDGHGNVMPGAKVDIGYLTDVTDPNTFSFLQSFSPSSTTTYDAIITGFGTAPKSTYLAFRNPGADQPFMIYIDDVVWEPIPKCNDVSKLAVTAATDTTVDLNWTPGISESAWQYVISSDALPDLTELTAVDVTSNSIKINTLSPATSYKVWVRSKCDITSLGAWIGPVNFTTNCTPVTDFSQNFDLNTNLPSCWFSVVPQSFVSVKPISGTPSTPNALYMSNASTTLPVIVAMQPVSNAGDGTHRLKLKYRCATVGAVLEVGYLNNLADSSSFISLKSLTTTNVNDFVSEILDLGFDPASQVLAFRVAGAPATVYIDDVVWEYNPTAIPAVATGITATPNPNCGTYATEIKWNNILGAEGYRISIGKVPGGTDAVNNLDLGNVLTYSFLGDMATDYYYTITPYNSFGDAKGNLEQTFVTNSKGCYCISNPISKDYKGITNVQLGATNFVNPSGFYSDFTSKPINLIPGVKENLKITFSTGPEPTLTDPNPSIGAKPYYTNVWIDANDNFIFEDFELLYTGESSTVAPNVLDASFSFYIDPSFGIHRIRIVAVYDNSTPDPCYSFVHGETIDLSVNIINPVQNDIPHGAINLVVGNDFAENAITGTNVNSTGSVQETEPGCGNYNGDDVWYSAIVPASGNVTFEVNSVSGGLTNTAGATYHGATDNLYLMNCDDSSSPAGDDHPRVSAGGRAPGELIYFRLWDNGGGNFGSYKVSAYDAYFLPLGVDSLEEINFSYYPNPVRDVLNLSFNQEINNVSVLNLLGQEVFSKSINAAQGKIDMSGLSAGAYLVKVTAGNQTKTIKVIKE